MATLAKDLQRARLELTDRNYKTVAETTMASILKSKQMLLDRQVARVWVRSGTTSISLARKPFICAVDQVRPVHPDGWSFKYAKTHVLFGTKLWKLGAAENGLGSSDLKLVLLEQGDRDRQRLERLRKTYTGIAGAPLMNQREPISEEVRIYVWRRDGGQCVKCGSRDRLEFDHIIPVTSGGASTARNVELLCERCNRSKGCRVC